MNLTPEQKRAIRKLVAAKKEIEASGLQFALIDEQMYLFDKNTTIDYYTIKDADCYLIEPFGFINSYGM